MLHTMVRQRSKGRRPRGGLSGAFTADSRQKRSQLAVAASYFAVSFSPVGAPTGGPLLAVRGRWLTTVATLPALVPMAQGEKSEFLDSVLDSVGVFFSVRFVASLREKGTRACAGLRDSKLG